MSVYEWDYRTVATSVLAMAVPWEHCAADGSVDYLVEPMDGSTAVPMVGCWVAGLVDQRAV